MWGSRLSTQAILDPGAYDQPARSQKNQNPCPKGLTLQNPWSRCWQASNGVHISENSHAWKQKRTDSGFPSSLPTFPETETAVKSPRIEIAFWVTSDIDDRILMQVAAGSFENKSW
jgi:hypothetical protein